MFYPTTCVGFRYGPTPGRTPRAGFLGSMLLRSCHSVHAPRVLSGLAGHVSAVPCGYTLQRAIPSARVRFASPSPLGLPEDGSRNIDRVSIRHALTGWR